MPRKPISPRSRWAFNADRKIRNLPGIDYSRFVVIPAHLLKELGWKLGDKLHFERVGDSLKVTRK